LFTFHIDQTEDTLLFFLYFLIALINTVLTFKIREVESKAREKEDKENVIRLYNTLFNSLSHELRTPISTIIGALDTLKENQDSLSENDRSELLSEIDKAGLRLNREVDNLLNMSRLESGTLKLKIDWCDLCEIIHRVIHKLIPKGSDRIIFNAPDNLPLFRLDGGIIEQVVYNLILNAIQHNPETTTIRIESFHRLDSCVITVSDDGKGFPEDKIANVFDKFYRLEGQKAGGIGLGLSIVKGFVEAHHGMVKLENTLPHGSMFTVEIPADTSYINKLKNE
jgi:two-component system sensor histidine kinase KdpD